MTSSSPTAKLTRLQQSIRDRKGLIGCHEGFSVALHSRGSVLLCGTDRRGQSAAERLFAVAAVVVGEDSLVLRMRDGTVSTVGRSPAEKAFADSLFSVRRIAVGPTHMAALLGNGRVAIGGEVGHMADEMATWPEVTDVVCGRNFTAGVTAGGDVLLCGGSHRMRHTVSAWHRIAGIFADSEGEALYAINDAGCVLSTAPLPHAAAAWKNVVFLAAAGRSLRAIGAAGQMLSTEPLEASFAESKSLIACAMSTGHALALSRDGYVIAAGRNDYGQCKTTAFGTLFEHFDELVADRHARNSAQVQAERAAQNRRTEALRFGRRLACGPRSTACITAYGRVLSSVPLGEIKQEDNILSVACGRAHMVALSRNGRVRAAGNNISDCCAVRDWQNIRAIAAGKYHSLGLAWDGRVYFCGLNDCGQGDIAEWTNIRTLAVADTYTVGVTFDGRLILTGHPPFPLTAFDEPYGRNGPISVVATDTHLTCLYSNGRVLTTLQSPDGYARPIFEGHAIAAIASGDGFTVALTYGGRVLAVGDRANDRCAVESWRHIVAVACGRAYTVGLTADGRLLVTGIAHGAPADCWADATRWEDIIAVTAGPDHLVAMNRNGQVLAAGADEDGQCSSTMHFTLFRDANQLYGYGSYRSMAEGEASLAATAVHDRA